MMTLLVVNGSLKVMVKVFDLSVLSCLTVKDCLMVMCGPVVNDHLVGLSGLLEVNSPEVTGYQVEMVVFGYKDELVSLERDILVVLENLEVRKSQVELVQLVKNPLIHCRGSLFLRVLFLGIPYSRCPWFH